MTEYVLAFLLGAQSIAWLYVEYERSQEKSNERVDDEAQRTDR